MVAGTAYYCAVYSWIAHRCWRKFRSCAFYLYIILMKKDQRYKALETMLVLVLAQLIAYWKYRVSFLLGAALITGLAGLFVPVAAKNIHWLWMKLAEGLGYVTSRILLTIIFVVIVIPLGWIAGKLGRSSVQLKAGGQSFFKIREHVFTKDDMENLW